MSGDLRGDHSRLTFDPRKRYTAVRQQQGRVQLDSDWNEQAEIFAHALREQARDLVGPSGAPGDGFRLIPRAALRFGDPGSFLRLGAGAVDLYERPEGLTVEAWVRIDEGSRGGALLSRFEGPRGEERASHLYLLAVEPDGRPRFNLGGRSGQNLVGERRLPAGRWTRLTLSHDRQRCRLWVDGREAGTLARGVEPSDRGAVFLVGLAHLGEELRQPFDGRLRELRLWAGSSPTPPEEVSGLLGHWRFETLRGGVVPDLSGHGQHALLEGGASDAGPPLELDGLEIGAGSFYADGVRCDNPERVDFERQPDLPGAELPGERAPGSAYLLYLDVWERSVSAAQDPDLAEPALGGADTTTRGRIVAQVRWLPVDLEGAPDDPRWLPPAWRRLAAGVERRPEASVRQAAGYNPVDNRLYRIEIHASGPAVAGGESDGDLEVEAVRATTQQVVLRRWPQAGPPAVGAWVAIAGGGAEPLAARVDRQHPGERALTLDRSLDRIDGVDGLVLRAVASCKWSRENGAVELPIQPLEPEGRIATLIDTGRGEAPLAEGDWVEIVDEGTVLAAAPGPLVRVRSVDAARGTVTLDRAPSGDAGRDAALRPLLRRWDQRADQGAPFGGGELAVVAGRWLPLENGLEVRFEPGRYRTGDYWAFAARRGSGVEWPASADGEPRPMPARGIDHRVAPLALLRFAPEGHELVDLRPVFRGLATGAVSKAGDRMHGRLEIRADPEAGPALEVAGAIAGDTLLGRLGTPAAVATHNLAEGAVTRSRIAPEVGTVPPGYGILGDHPTPPPGFEYSGSRLSIPDPEATWRERAAIDLVEDPGDLVSVAVDGRVYTFSAGGRVWCWDSRRGGLEERRGMPEPRGRFGAAAVSGRIYLVGGVDAEGERLASVLELEPETDAWRLCADLPTPRSDVAVTVCDDRLYVLGGLRDWFFLEVASRRNEVYDPRIDGWSRRRGLPSARYAASAAPGQGGIYLFGGERRWFLRWKGRAVSAVTEQFLPGVDRWQRKESPLPAPRSRAGAVVVADEVHLVGGRSLFGATGDHASYTPESDLWVPAAPLPLASGRTGVAAVDGLLVAHVVEEGHGAQRLKVFECRVAGTYYVHRKRFEPESELEPQLGLDGIEADALRKE